MTVKKKKPLYPANIWQHNAWNTFVSCVAMLPLLVFAFLFGYQINAIFGAITATDLSLGTLMVSSLFLSVGLPAGLIVFVLRLVSPYAYKYTLRYNFFATLNFIFGLVGLIHDMATAGGNDSGFMSTAFVLGTIWLFDIYFIKLKRIVPRL